MRRWLFLLLLAILPLQFSWAAVASYCQHETTPSQAAHFGHHEHEHEATSTASAAAADDTHSEKSPVSVDADCAFCHLGHAQTLLGQMHAVWVPLPSPMVGLQASLYASHIPDTPERPDRRIA